MKKIRWKITLQKNYIPNSNFWTWIRLVHLNDLNLKFTKLKTNSDFGIQNLLTLHIFHMKCWNTSFIHWSFVDKAIYFLSSFLSTYIWFGELQSHFSPLFFLNAAWKIFILWHRRNEPMIYGLRIESETSMSIFYGRGLPITSLR